MLVSGDARVYHETDGGCQRQRRRARRAGQGVPLPRGSGELAALAEQHADDHAGGRPARPGRRQVSLRLEGDGPDVRLNGPRRAREGSWWADFCGVTAWVLHLIVWSRSGVCDVRDGDSRGPFYFKWTTSPPQIGIRGTVNARSSDNRTCYGMQYGRIASALGYSIYTG